jgi:hypothetical protein
MKNATFFQDSLRLEPHFVAKLPILLKKTIKKGVGQKKIIQYFV